MLSRKNGVSFSFCFIERYYFHYVMFRFLALSADAWTCESCGVENTEVECSGCYLKPLDARPSKNAAPGNQKKLYVSSAEEQLLRLGDTFEEKGIVFVVIVMQLFC